MAPFKPTVADSSSRRVPDVGSSRDAEDACPNAANTSGDGRTRNAAFGTRRTSGARAISIVTLAVMPGFADPIGASVMVTWLTTPVRRRAAAALRRCPQTHRTGGTTRNETDPVEYGRCRIPQCWRSPASRADSRDHGQRGRLHAHTTVCPTSTFREITMPSMRR
jgi:hypothetical protein